MYKGKGETKMKKSNLMKLFSILLITVMVMMFSTSVLAATDDDFTALTVPGSSNNTNTNNSNTNTNTNSSNTNRTNTNRTNTNNSSTYNNTNLPKTGVESSIPVVALVVIFGVSAVYAYKKIKDYKNI